MRENPLRCSLTCLQHMADDSFRHLTSLLVFSDWMRLPQLHDYDLTTYSAIASEHQIFLCLANACYSYTQYTLYFASKVLLIGKGGPASRTYWSVYGFSFSLTVLRGHLISFL